MEYIRDLVQFSTECLHTLPKMYCRYGRLGLCFKSCVCVGWGGGGGGGKAIGTGPSGSGVSGASLLLDYAY